MDDRLQSTRDGGRTMGRRTVWTTLAVVLALLIFVAAALYVAMLWPSIDSAGRGPSETTAEKSGLLSTHRDHYRTAMDKVGVQAAMPATPQPVDTLEVEGSHPFEATLTSLEVTALMNAHPYQPAKGVRSLELRDPVVRFSEANEVRVQAGALLDGRSYNASIEGSATARNNIVTGELHSATVQGFRVPQQQQDELENLVFEYVTRWLQSCPGLRIDRARIVDGGVQIRGVAPDRILGQSG